MKSTFASFYSCLMISFLSAFTSQVVLSAAVEQWDDRFGVPNWNTDILSVDESESGIVAVGGAFSGGPSPGNLNANKVALWNGRSWSATDPGPYTQGPSDVVRAVRWVGSNLYAGGNFFAVNGTVMQRIARWNGSVWMPLISGGSNGVGGYVVNALASSGSNLYVGGDFTSAGSISASRIARWSGTAWAALGTGVLGGSSPQVLAISVAPDGSVYAGGKFTTAGGVAAANIAKWNGSAWSALGTGITGGNGLVQTIAIATNGDVVAGGDFTTAGGQPAQNLARWNGSAWQQVAGGVQGGPVLAAAYDSNDLWIGGKFTQANGNTNFAGVAVLQNGAWQSPEIDGLHYIGNSPPEVHSLSVEPDGVYLAGRFNDTHYLSGLLNVVKWDRTRFVPMHRGFLGYEVYPRAISAAGTNVFVVGDFTSVGGQPARRVARWDGADWHVLGTAQTNGVGSFQTVRSVAALANGQVYIGGTFSSVAGTSTRNIAHWTGNAWQGFGAGLQGGNNESVKALVATSDGTLYAAGTFTSAGGVPVNHIARWDGTNWSQLGNGLTRSSNPDSTSVSALAWTGDRLYAAGSFDHSGALPVGSVAWWDGQSWNAMDGSPTYVSCLAVQGYDVFIGGDFSQVGGITASNIARWRPGGGWSALGAGISGNTPLSLVLHGGRLYAGGNFSIAGGLPIRCLAEWDGADWQTVGGGLLGDEATTYGVAAGGTIVYAAGQFNGAGTVASTRFAILNMANAPPTVAWVGPAQDATYLQNGNLTLEATPSDVDGTIAQVQFFHENSDTPLATLVGPPWQFTWNAAPVGTNRFVARVVDDAGSVSYSLVRRVRVLLPDGNSPPTVAIFVPTNNSSVLAGTNLQIVASASDLDPGPLSVEIFEGTNSLGAGAGPVYQETVTNISEGDHWFHAVVTDSLSGTGTSSVVRVHAVLKKWEYGVVNPGFKSPALGTDGNILLGASEWLYALDTSGTPVWVRQLNSDAVLSSVTVADDGTIYFGSSLGQLYARNPDGTPKWNYAIGGPVSEGPALGEDGTVYIGGSNGKLYAINPSGTKKWEYTAILARPVAVAGDGSVYFGSGDGYLTSLNANGQFLWQFPVDGGIGSRPAIGADGTIYFGSGSAGKFYAVNPSGTQKWMLPISGGVSDASPSIGLDGTIFCGTFGGNLLAIRPDGTLKWSLFLGGEIEGTPAVAQDGSLYVGNGSGRKFFHVSQEGVKIWEFSSSSGYDFAHSPLILDNGDVIATTQDAAFLLAGTNGPAGGPWPMYMQNRQHTGRGWDAPAPNLTSPAPESVFVAGDSVSLAVDVTASYPIASVEYLSNSNLIAMVATAPFSTNWTATGGVQYIQARVTDTIGANRTTEAVRIKVVPPGTAPSILASPVAMTTITNGGGVVLRVDAFGSGPLTYLWHKDGVLLPWGSGPELVLNGTSLADAAKYHVQVTNAFGHAESAQAAVHVLQPVVVRWTSEAGTEIHTTPVIGAGGIIYYGRESGELFAYDPRGIFEWRFDTEPVSSIYDLVSSPALDTDGIISFATVSGSRLYRIKPDGTEQDHFIQTGGSEASPALGTNGNIYVGAGSESDSLRAYSPTGTVLWQLPVPGRILSAPAVGRDGSIYVTSLGLPGNSNLTSGTLTAITPSGGFKWAYVTGDGVVSSPTLGSDETVYLGSRDMKFYALSTNGVKQWEFPTDGPIEGSAVVAADGTIYFGNFGAFIPEIGIRKGHLYALDPTGQLKWSFTAGGEIHSTPALAADGTIYFGADDWNVYALNPNGTLRWKYQIEGKVRAGLAIGFDGTVYAGSTALNALFENPSPLANSPWPKFKHDLRGTGNAATTNESEAWIYPFTSNAFDDQVNTITVQGSNIYVGGAFNIAGGRLAKRVAKWDGQQWSALGAGIDGQVLASAWYNGELYVGGSFLKAGGQDISNLARWNGTTWSPVVSGINEYVGDLVVHDGSLFVGGGFGSVARWDGVAWHDTGTNAPLFPTTLAALNGSLHAVARVGAVGNSRFALLRWNGNGWEEISGGFASSGGNANIVAALAYYNGQIYAGGSFNAISNLAINGIARWTGATWEALNEGTSNSLSAVQVQAMTVMNGALYVGGGFQKLGDLTVNSLARWDGSSWSALGTGLTRSKANNSGGSSEALAVQGNTLLVGGNFLTANGNRDIHYFAKWEGGDFSAFGARIDFSEGFFRFTLFPPGRGLSYGIEASSNLVNWERIITYTNLTEATEFIDVNSSTNSKRYYRAVSP